MEPTLFGESPRRLFGIYHPPATEVDRPVGLVLCQPWGQEHIRSYRALLRLAKQLSLSGHHVLRFDYTGCGDSSGSSEDGRIEVWLADIATAVEELKLGTGLRQVGLIGLRLGAHLALKFGESSPLASLVLWNPVINGVCYLEELRVLHREWQEGSFTKGRRASEQGDEILGFRLTTALRSDLSGIQACDIGAVPARAVMLLTDEPSAEAESLRAHLENLGAHVEAATVPSHRFWHRETDVSDQPMVPVKAIEAIVRWVDGQCS